MPSLAKLVPEVVYAGYDGANEGYAGFCYKRQVVINLFPMVKANSAKKALPADATHELTLTLCHELAHLLEPRAPWLRRHRRRRRQSRASEPSPRPAASDAGCRSPTGRSGVNR